jgi:hypothetical protein
VNKSARHIAVYYDQHSPAWTQCAKLIASFNARAWKSVYVHDEHSSASVRTGLNDAHAKTRSRKTITPSIVASSEFGFQNTPVRVSGILANLRSEVNAALEHGAKGVLFLIEMTWAIRTPSGAVYLREYEAAIHELTLELPVAFACLHNQHLLLASQLLSMACTRTRISCRPAFWQGKTNAPIFGTGSRASVQASHRPFRSQPRAMCFGARITWTRPNR